ncbi:MAG: hypothetical protein HYV13_03095 [Candidatus Doudnabacteria bacterium]|nr:hypothetical protein [Candidatus Doudnabacteria bacterium]
MENDKWEGLKEEIKRKFKILEEKTEDVLGETSDGLVKQGVAEVLIIKTPMGKIKLVRENRPAVLDKKFIYSHRAGQAGRTEYTFSDTEFSHKLRAFKWDEDEDDWKEIDAKNFGN